MITSQPPRGMRDLLPEEMIKRQYVMDIIKKIFMKYGFDPLESPAVEYAEVLEGKYGREGEKLVYKFKDKGGRDLALRYDLTVPLSRIVAANPTLNKPFKRYQIARVWRYDRPGKGRYKEFWQCDVDSVGSASIVADAEIIAVALEVLESLGFKDYTLKMNNRKILNSMIELVGIPLEKANGVLNSLDKLEKIGSAGVKEELAAKGISPAQIKNLERFFSIGGTNQEILKKLGTMLKTEEGKQGIKEMNNLLLYLEGMGLQKKYRIVISLVRGLDYYTGLIFETTLNDVAMGSVSGGGRYDSLIGKFSGTDVPATGISIGIERIIDIMKETQMNLPKEKTLTKVFIANVDEESLAICIQVASFLRKNNINAQFNVAGKKFGKQLEYANALGIPFVLIVGKEEVKQKEITLKNMKTGIQQKVKQEKLIELLS